MTTTTTKKNKGRELKQKGRQIGSGIWQQQHEAARPLGAAASLRDLGLPTLYEGTPFEALDYNKQNTNTVLSELFIHISQCPSTS
jgi:hypothetical protein